MRRQQAAGGRRQEAAGGRMQRERSSREEERQGGGGARVRRSAEEGRLSRRQQRTFSRRSRARMWCGWGVMEGRTKRCARSRLAWAHRRAAQRRRAPRRVGCRHPPLSCPSDHLGKPVNPRRQGLSAGCLRPSHAPSACTCACSAWRRGGARLPAGLEPAPGWRTRSRARPPIASG